MAKVTAAKTVLTRREPLTPLPHLLPTPEPESPLYPGESPEDFGETIDVSGGPTTPQVPPTVTPPPPPPTTPSRLPTPEERYEYNVETGGGGYPGEPQPAPTHTGGIPIPESDTGVGRPTPMSAPERYQQQVDTAGTAGYPGEFPPVQEGDVGIVPDVVIPEGAVATEWFAAVPGVTTNVGQVDGTTQGQIDLDRPSAYFYEGETYYVPGSNPYEMGFRTQSEVKLAHSLGLTYGPHSGNLVPPDSVLIYSEDLGAWIRVRPSEYGRVTGIIDNYMIPVTGLDSEGNEVLMAIDPGLLEIVNQYEGEERFAMLQAIGIYPPNVYMADGKIFRMPSVDPALYRYIDSLTGKWKSDDAFIEAVAAGITDPAVYQRSGYNVTQEDIESARLEGLRRRGIVSASERYQQELATIRLPDDLAPYVDSATGNLDLYAAVAAGITDPRIYTESGYEVTQAEIDAVLGFISENVEVKSTDSPSGFVWIPSEDWSSLGATDRELVQSQGWEAYVAKFESENVQVKSTDSPSGSVWIPVEFWNSLSPSEQKVLARVGWENYQERLWRQYAATLTPGLQVIYRQAGGGQAGADAVSSYVETTLAGLSSEGYSGQLGVPQTFPGGGEPFVAFDKQTYDIAGALAGGFDRAKLVNVFGADAVAAVESRSDDAIAKWIAENSPAYLRKAYDEGGIVGYNAAVQKYNEVMEKAKGIWLTTPTGERILVFEGAQTEEARKAFGDEYAAMMQPAGISDEDYARIASFVRPEGFDSKGAFAADAPRDIINKFVLATVDGETLAKIKSGELTLLPYGQIVDSSFLEGLPPTTSDLITKFGTDWYENYLIDVAQVNRLSFWLNPRKFITTRVVAGFKDLGNALLNYLQLQLTQLYPEVKEGDIKRSGPPLSSGMMTTERYKLGEVPESIAGMPVIGATVWPVRYTAEEAARINARNEKTVEQIIDTYNKAEMARSEWLASHPTLYPIYPDGFLQSARDNPMALLDPTLYAETIIDTVPYTVSTLALMLGGSLVAGPVGLAAGSVAAFAITWGSEGQQIYDDAIANGATHKRALELANSYGAISAAVETIGDAVFVGMLNLMSKPFANALGKNVAREVISEAAKKYGWENLTKDLIINWLNQAGQEVVQEVIHNAAIKTVNANRPLLEGTMDAFVAGLVGTAPFVLLPAGVTASKIAKSPTVADIKAGRMVTEVEPRGVAIQRLQQEGASIGAGYGRGSEVVDGVASGRKPVGIVLANELHLAKAAGLKVEGPFVFQGNQSYFVYTGKRPASAINEIKRLEKQHNAGMSVSDELRYDIRVGELLGYNRKDIELFVRTNYADDLVQSVAPRYLSRRRVPRAVSAGGATVVQLSPAEQRAALERVMRPTSNFAQMSMIADPAEARRVSALYNIMGAKALEYGKTKLEQSQVRQAISELGLARTKDELNLLEQLKAKEAALGSQVESLANQLQKAVDDYVNAMSSNIGADVKQAQADELDKMRRDMLRDIDTVVDAIMGMRTLTEIAKDMDELSSQISELDKFIAEGGSAERLRTIEALREDISSQVSALAMEARNRYLATGEEVSADASRAIVKIASLQQRLVEANMELAKFRESVLPYDIYRKGELLGEIESATAARDIFEAIQNVMEPVYGRESYSRELGVLEDAVRHLSFALVGDKGSLADFATTLGQLGMSENSVADVSRAVEGVSDALNSRKSEAVERAIDNLENSVNIEIDPDVRAMVLAGGSYIRANVSDLLRMVEIHDIFGSLEQSPTWGDTRVKLVELRDVYNKAKKDNPTISTSLSSINWFQESRKPFREETRQLSWEETKEQQIIQDRVQKLIERMPSLRRANLYRALQKSGDVRQEALNEMWDYFAEVYGASSLDSYIKTGEWEAGTPEGLESSVKGVEDAEKIREKIDEDEAYEKELDDALDEIDRLLRENKDKPPDAPAPENRPSPPPSRSGTRVAVKERTETKAQRVREKTEELTEQEKKELVEKVKAKEAEERIRRRVRKATEAATEQKITEHEAAQVAKERAAERRQSVFPGIKEKTITQTRRLGRQGRERIGSMTPEQAQRLYGEEMRTTVAYSPYIMTRTGAVEDAKTSTWVSPDKAIRDAQKAAAQPAIRAAPTTVVQPSISPVISTAISAATQVATQDATQTTAQTAAQQQTQTQTEAQTQQQTKLQEQIQIQEQLQEQKRIIVPPIILPKGGGEGGNQQEIPPGSIAWRQGAFWKYIPPPYDRLKPITLARGITPMGAVRTNLRTTKETIQKIGDSDAVVPDKISADLGVTDLFISNQAQDIDFAGGGLETDVGERIPTTSQGMSVNGGVETSGAMEPKGHAYARKVYPAHSVSRTSMDKESPPRVTPKDIEVQGINRPKITEDTESMLDGSYEEPVTGDEYPDLLATGYGKEVYFDEDPEWLEGLEPAILKTRKKPFSLARSKRLKPMRGGDDNPTTIRGLSK